MSGRAAAAVLVTLEELNTVPVHRAVTIPRMIATLEARNETQRSLKSRDQYIFALRRVLAGSDSAVTGAGASGRCPEVEGSNEAAKSFELADSAGVAGSRTTTAVTPVTQTQTNKRCTVTQPVAQVQSAPARHPISNRLLGPTCGGTASDTDRRATMFREDDSLWSLEGSIQHANHVGHNSTHAPLKITGEQSKKRRTLAEKNGVDGAGGGAQATQRARPVITNITPRDAMLQALAHLSTESTRLNRADAHDRQTHGPRVDLTLLMWREGKCFWLSTRSFSERCAQRDARRVLAALGDGEANVFAVDVTGTAAVCWGSPDAAGTFWHASDAECLVGGDLARYLGPTQSVATERGAAALVAGLECRRFQERMEASATWLRGLLGRLASSGTTVLLAASARDFAFRDCHSSRDVRYN